MYINIFQIQWVPYIGTSPYIGGFSRFQLLGLVLSKDSHACLKTQNFDGNVLKVLVIIDVLFMVSSESLICYSSFSSLEM